MRDGKMKIEMRAVSGGVSRVRGEGTGARARRSGVGVGRERRAGSIARAVAEIRRLAMASRARVTQAMRGRFRIWGALSSFRVNIRMV